MSEWESVPLCNYHAKNPTKQDVFSYWNEEACGTGFTNEEKYSIDYFEEIEAIRYKLEPYIYSFAQFDQYRNKKILEVGVGAGSDFINWLKMELMLFRKKMSLCMYQAIQIEKI